MPWKGTAIDHACLGGPVPGRSVRLILGMDRCHGRFQVFQGQIELVGIGLLGLAPEGCLLEGRNQLLKSFDPFILAGDLGVLACLTRLRRNQHRLQGGNIIGKIGGVQHLLEPSKIRPALPSESGVLSHRAAAIRWSPVPSSRQHEPAANRDLQRGLRTGCGSASSGHP